MHLQLVNQFPSLFALFSSQFEEKFEEISGAEPPPSIPSTSGYDEETTAAAKYERRDDKTEMQGQGTLAICSDANAPQDFVSGIMKIVPEVDVSVIMILLRMVEYF